MFPNTYTFHACRYSDSVRLQWNQNVTLRIPSCLPAPAQGLAATLRFLRELLLYCKYATGNFTFLGHRSQVTR